MDKEQQIKFVEELSDRIRDEVVSKIKAGKTLQAWDGHELRTLLANKHADSAGMSAWAMRGKRGRCFRNHVIVANL